MPDRRGSRFVLEVLFLLGLAVALTLADLRPLEIAGIMLVGWVIVAALEWAAWREEPHFGSGLPPRYYVPQVNLPPAQPLEQVSAGYPETRDEAPTWIASASMRAELLGEWPVAAPPVSPPEAPAAEAVEPEAVEPEAELDPDPWTIPEELPAAPLGELDPEPEVEPVALPQPDEVSDTAPVTAEPTVVAEVSDTVDVPAPEPVDVAEDVPVDVDSAEPEPVKLPEPSLDVVLQRSVQRTARYSLDPLADPVPRKRFGRGGAPPAAAVLDVPARPEGARPLPGRSNRQD